MTQEHPQNYSEKDFSLLSKYLDEIVNRIEPFETEPLAIDKIYHVKELIHKEGEKLGGHVEQDVKAFVQHVDYFLQNQNTENFNSFLSKAVKLKNDLWCL